MGFNPCSAKTNVMQGQALLGLIHVDRNPGDCCLTVLLVCMKAEDAMVSIPDSCAHHACLSESYHSALKVEVIFLKKSALLE